MDFSSARFTALCLLFVAATGAPTAHSPQDPCADVRNSALEFNQITKNEAKNLSKGIKTFNTSLAWMEAQDMCDPWTLRHTPAPCIKRIFEILTSYKSFVETFAKFKSCSLAHKVNEVLLKLHNDMSKCVKSRTENHDQKVNDISEKVEALDWERKLLCDYTIERLFSFSILTARVFSVGDPANHAESTAPTCTQSS